MNKNSEWDKMQALNKNLREKLGDEFFNIKHIFIGIESIGVKDIKLCKCGVKNCQIAKAFEIQYQKKEHCYIPHVYEFKKNKKDEWDKNCVCGLKVCKRADMWEMK